MRYYSTIEKKYLAGLREAVIKGLAPDGGLYMPERIPVFTASELKRIKEESFEEISFQVAQTLMGEAIPADELKKIIRHTIAFDAPLKELEAGVYALELFHGPTLAFKDFGARFLSGLFSYFARESEKEIVILVATSGDTGSAVANAFYHVAGTRVLVLYPSGKVSDMQEKQFTTLGGNITALEVEGTFDDCQRLVKQAFADKELNEQFFLTSANSINIGRLIPQTFYYFRAWAQWQGNSRLMVSVPSGNFGNLTAGLIAKRMGLPIAHFIAATNGNRVVPDYLLTEKFSPRASIPTISNAMDVGNPSNFARMLDLYDHQFKRLKADVTGYSFTDDETRRTVKSVFEASGYVLDPHGAVGYRGLKKYMDENAKGDGIFLATAHPAKFREVVEPVIRQSVELPPRLQQFLSGVKKSVAISSRWEDLRSLLPSLIAQ
jgi:threonine synthase